MTIWPPPCCFEGELAEIENYTQARLEFGIPFHAAAKAHPIQLDRKYDDHSL